MKHRLKGTLLALGTGLIALNAGACAFRWLGDLVADTLILRSVA